MNKELPILISFSGGRTSAFMAKFLMEHPDYSDREKIVVFANTGKEFEATLDFVHECDKRWDLNVVWVEALVDLEKGVGTSFTITNYKDADRNGRIFESMMNKYGLPNKQYPHCTRELKQKPIKRYMQSLGYDDWITAVGIRADEKHRLNPSEDGNFKNPFFPLAHLIQVDEKFIRNYWDRQEFDLQLKDYQSNCDLCWKKSKRKKLTLIQDDAKIADWWSKMENKFSDGQWQFDQREGFTIEQLVEMAQQPFQRHIDVHELSQQQGCLFDFEMDYEEACFCKST